MKRYIEIVYDNSQSMTGHIGNKKKYEIAQNLFEKEILPIIGLKGDYIVLRLLGEGCREETSNSVALTIGGINDRKYMLNRIKSINPSKNSTPLFYTMLDAIQACKNERADESLIFVLTDGDDTCNVKMEELISEDLIEKYVKFYKVLLVQLGINDNKSKNNLTAFTSYLGGQTISLESGDSDTLMRSKLKKALNISGFSVKLPLQHCYDSQPGFNLTWEEVENIGIDFHQALLLHNKNILSWKPEYTLSVSTLQLAELKFLFGLYFKTGLEDSMIKTMLAQLKMPYYYSHDCIYWDFLAARWKYFIPQNIIKQMDNPEAKNDDKPNKNNIDDINEIEKETYYQQKTYLVKLIPTKNPGFQLMPVDQKQKIDNIRILTEGDFVKFKMK